MPAHSAVLITGASTGLGKHAALELAGKGYAVFAGIRKESDGAALLAALPAATAKNLFPVILDVTSDDSIAAAVEVVKGALGAGGAFSGRRLAGLVNNAGVCFTGFLETIPKEKVGENGCGARVSFTSQAPPTIRTPSPLLLHSTGTVHYFQPVVPASCTHHRSRRITM